MKDIIEFCIEKDQNTIYYSSQENRQQPQDILGDDIFENTAKVKIQQMVKTDRK